MSAAVWTGQVHAEGLRWGVPAIAPTMPSFSVESFLTLSVPLVVMVVGLGNVQGIGFLVSEGYRPPIKLITVVVGITSVVNALLGGHPSTIQRGGTAIVAGRDAGPIGSRYVAALIASAWALLLAFTATTSQSIADVLPMGVVSVFAGLAILSPLMDALKRAMAAERSAGAFVAFAISMSSTTALGLDSAFWALASGWLVYRLLDRPAHSKPAVGVHEDTVGGARKRAA